MNTQSSPQNDHQTYRLPPQNIVDILDAPSAPSASLSPDRKTLLLAEYTSYPSIALLAKPILKLGGVRIDPSIDGTQRMRFYTGFTLIDIATGARTIVDLPSDIKISEGASWSRNGQRFAFCEDTDAGIKLWVGDLRGKCRRYENIVLSDTLLSPIQWRDDSCSLLVTLVDTERGTPPIAPLAPTGPIITETEGKMSRMATYQDLLKSPFDEDQFVYYGATQVAVLDVESGDLTPLLPADLWMSVRPSPDENYLLTNRLTKPFSFRVPYWYFTRTVEVRNVHTGALVYTVADLPISDEIPQQGVPTGARNVQWQEMQPATLLWTEALDGGDPTRKVEHRDKLISISAPFADPPHEILKITHRFSRLDWFETPNNVLLTEYDRDRRWRTTYSLDLTSPESSRKTLFDLSVNDAYNDPGSPIYQRKANGDMTILQDGDRIYLSGRGATTDGDRPFLDAYTLSTGETERLFQCGETEYELFVAFLDENRQTLLTSRQSKTEPPNFFKLDRNTGARTAMTDFQDPHPQITGLSKELIKYNRADGVPLSGTLVTPPGYDKDRDGCLPLLVWAYPEEYSDASTAGQVRGSTRTFTRLAGSSPLWFVTQGYAVLLDATMPVVGDPETMNDTFVTQIVGAAQAAIDAVADLGIADPNRVLVSGHSYGAFMTANLLAHCDLFAAGIARSGAYNRTLTPFGFQSERRSYWEAPDIYRNLSPFTYADKITAPLLLIHGQDDNNPGTYTVQSERFYQALAANGATARLVLLPHESHGYAARESILHVLAEMFAWADRYVKNRQSDGRIEP